MPSARAPHPVRPVAIAASAAGPRSQLVAEHSRCRKQGPTTALVASLWALAVATTTCFAEAAKAAPSSRRAAAAQRGAAALADAPTPVAPDLLALERAQLLPAPTDAPKRIAALRLRLLALEQARNAAPMAADAAPRDQDLADAERDLALLTWHAAHDACARAASAAAAAALGGPAPRPPKRASAPAPVPTCPPPPLALGPAIASYQRVLAELPQYRRAEEVRFQIACLALRQAREDNDPARALQARAGLGHLEQTLPPSGLRAWVTAWLADDDAAQGRDDLAHPRWQGLMAGRAAAALEVPSLYARSRLAWTHWSRGRGEEALALLAEVERARLPALLAARWTRDLAWLRARLAAQRARDAASRAPTLTAPTAAAATAPLTATPDAAASARPSGRGHRRRGGDGDGAETDAAPAKKAKPGEETAPRPPDANRWPRQPAPRVP